MSIALWALTVAEDNRTKLPHVRVAARLARLADDAGVIGTDEHGRPLADPRSIAAAAGVGESTVYSALSALDKLGFIAWNKASYPERFSGMSGRIRLILSREA